MEPGQRYLKSSEKKLKARVTGGKSRREREEVMQMTAGRGWATVMRQEGQEEEED